MQVQLVKNTPKTWKMAEPIGGFWSSPPPPWGLFGVPALSVLNTAAVTQLTLYP